MKGCKAWADRAHAGYENKATPTLHDNDQPNAALAGGNSGARQIFKLGLDVDLNNAVTAIQCGTWPWSANSALLCGMS
jgi:hypothetical protein